MSKILISGASGFVGRASVVKLLEQGCELIAVSTQAPLLSHPKLEWVQIEDITQVDWQALLSGVSKIFHLAGVAHKAQMTMADYERVNVAVSMSLARAAVAQNVHTFIYLSSVSVYGRKQGPEALTSGVKPRPDDANGHTKYQAEQALQELASGTTMAMVILRVPLIYGPGAPGNFGRLIKLVSRVPLLPFGMAHNKRSYVSIYNLVSAFACLQKAPKVRSGVFHVTDQDDISTADLMKVMARAGGRGLILLPVPKLVLTALASLLNRSQDIERLYGNFCVNSDCFTQEFGWLPEENVASSMEKFYDKCSL